MGSRLHFFFAVCIAAAAAALFGVRASAQATCTVSIINAELPFERAGGPGLAQVTASTPTCAWTISNGTSWVTFSSGTTGTGSAYVPFTVDPLPDGTAYRSGTFSIGSSSTGVQQGISGIIGSIESPPSGSTVVSPFTISGWAMHDTGTSDDAYMDLYYAPGTNYPSTLLAHEVLTDPRQHIADRWGSAYLQSGFSVSVSLTPGTYNIGGNCQSAVRSFYWACGSTKVTVVAPSLTLNVTQVRAGVVVNGGTVTAVTPSQPVIVGGIGTAAWTAAPQQPWIVLSQQTGTGDGRFLVSFDFTKTSLPAAGIIGGTIQVSATGLGAVNVPVYVTVYQPGTTAIAFGAFESPADNATGLAGAIPITGWALDDVGVTRVQIYRDPVSTEAQGALVYVGDAPPVEGARPDVAAAYPAYPSSTSAGWGYMLLSNMLPGQGNGTFKFYAYAQDAEGTLKLLGAKTITIDNSSSTKPFGTLDFPAQGEVVSGSYTSQGWILTPQPAVIRPDGSLAAVVIDGQWIGRPLLGQSRPDVATLFPGLYNTSIAGGKFTFDTRLLKNGIHTIAWSIQDDLGRTQGIGSRYFIVNNP